MEAVDNLIRRLRKADDAARAEIKQSLIDLVRGPDGGSAREAIEGAMKGELLALAKASPEWTKVRDHLENARKALPLEMRWDLDEVIEAITPPPAPPPEAPTAEEPPPAKKGITAADLNLVYDDPRGLMLYKTKVGPERWFATQVDPRTGQPQTFELHATEVTQIKQQLAGSPYWLLGAGGASSPLATPK